MICPIFSGENYMTRLRHFCVASVLTFALAFSALGGDIGCGIVPDPPASMTAEVDTGATGTDETSTEITFVDPMTEFTLNILQSFLSLF
jgi:hypothetical protein